MATILIIDDRPLNRQFLTTLLGYQHHRLYEASDGAEGLRVARKERPDLIISDVLMPTMDGYEFVRRLREEPEIGKTPVIFSTAHYLSRESQSLAEKCGIASIISKPCEPEIVLRIVDDALNGRAVIEPPTVSAKDFDREHQQLLMDQLSQKANEISEVNQKLTALFELSQQLLLERDPLQLLDNYCEAARAVVGAKWAALALTGDDEKSCGHFHAIGLDEGMSAQLKSNAMTSRLFRELTTERQPLRFSNRSPDAWPEEFSGISSLLAVPVVLQQKVQGWLCLVDKLGASEFAEADRELVATLSAQMGVAYDNATLLKDTRQQSQEIESQRRRLNNIVASIPGVVWEAWGEPDAATQRINFVSGYVETMLGYSVDEWRSTPNFWLSIVHPDDREEAANIAAASFASGKSSPQEFRWVGKDGRIVWVESNYAVVADEEGRPVGLRGVTLDITERKTLEEQLRQAQKMEAIGTLAGGIAHDFNNILGAIIGYSELARREIGPDSRAQTHLEQVLTASGRARDLVRQILTFSRHEEPEREALQLQPIIDETLKLIRASVPSTIEFRQDIATAVPSVLADATQIQQVIMNLCTNAGHAMKEHGGVLEIRLAYQNVDPGFATAHAELREGPHICLTVSDTGCGMDRATQERIFDPFFTTKAPGEGTGLGLAVVHGIVKNHSGAISVDSEPGAGTSFNVYLPVYPGQTGPLVHTSVQAPRGNGEHVLFVDDEEALASLWKSLLEDLGYLVTTRTNSVEALAVFKSQPGDFDLVITNQTMPHMNGADLARALLEIRPELPVILASGDSTSVSPDEAKAIGIRELLYKPNSKAGLAEAIRRALGQKTREEAMASILLVDDDDQFRAMLSEVLIGAGYQVQETADGSKGIELYRYHPTDVVITDVIMPEKEGLEMITELKRLDANAKIIAISGGGRGSAQNYLKIAKTFGAQRVLAKPFSHQEILETVCQVLQG